MTICSVLWCQLYPLESHCGTPTLPYTHYHLPIHILQLSFCYTPWVMDSPCIMYFKKGGIYFFCVFRNTRRYGPLRFAGLLLSPAEGFGLWTRLFFALRAKKELIMLCGSILGHFWCPVVTSITFSSNVSNFKKNPQKPKKK